MFPQSNNLMATINCIYCKLKKINTYLQDLNEYFSYFVFQRFVSEIRKNVTVRIPISNQLNKMNVDLYMYITLIVYEMVYVMDSRTDKPKKTQCAISTFSKL